MESTRQQEKGLLLGIRSKINERNLEEVNRELFIKGFPLPTLTIWKQKISKLSGRKGIWWTQLSPNSIRS